MTAKRSGTDYLNDIFGAEAARQWPPSRPSRATTKDVPPVIVWLVILACVLFPTLVLLKL